MIPFFVSKYIDFEKQYSSIILLQVLIVQALIFKTDTPSKMHTPTDGSKADLAIAKLHYGVQMLQNKNYHNAAALFKDGLAIAKDCDFGTTSIASNPGKWVCFVHPQECQPLNYDTADCFIFQSPIVVSDTKDMVGPSGQLLTSIIVYNLALTYHLGAAHIKPSEYIFRKALGCYQLAHNLQHQSNDMDNEFGELLRMAIANNIGHIHWMAGNDTKATQCFQHLLKTIMYLLNCGCWTSIILNHPFLEGFLHNCQRWILLAQPSPAA